MIRETDETIWRSCCLTIDRQAAKYFIQVAILSSLIILSSSMLVIDKECNSNRNWSSLLTLCLGVFLPAPKIT